MKADTQKDLSQRVSQAQTNVIQLFDQGNYQGASALLKEEQKTLFRDFREEILQGWEKIKNQVGLFPFELHYNVTPARTNSITYETMDSLSELDIYFRDISLNIAKEGPVRALYSQLVNNSLQKKMDEFKEYYKSQKEALESRLTTEGVGTFMGDFKSLSDFISLIIEDTSNERAAEANNALRTIFNSMAKTTLCYCMEVIDCLNKADGYKKRSRSTQTNIGSLIEEDLQHNFVALQGLIEQSHDSKYIRIGEVVPKLRIGLYLDEEELGKPFKVAYDKLDSEIDKTSEKIGQNMPKILVSIEPGSVKPYEGNFLLIILNQCDTENAILSGSPGVVVSKYGIGNKKLGSTPLETKTEVEGYIYKSYILGLPLVGPERVTAVEVQVIASNRLFKEKLSYTTRLEIPKPAGFTTAKPIQNQQG